MMNGKSYHWTLVAVAMLFLTLSAQPAGAKSESFTDTFDKTYPMEPSGRFTFKGVNEDVSLQAWDKETLEVRATFKGKGQAPEVRIDPDPADFTIEVDRESGRKKYQSVTFAIRVPGGVQVEVGVVSGDVSVQGVRGGLDVETVSGDVDAARVGKRLDVETVSGDLYLNDVDVKRCSLKTVSGKLEAHSLGTGNLSHETVSGDVKWVSSRCESLRLETVSGDVHYAGELVEGGSFELSTYSGDVTLVLPKSTSFRIDMDTFSGDLSCDFPLDKIARENGEKLSGIHGGGKSEIKVDTFSGNVEIRKGGGNSKKP